MRLERYFLSLFTCCLSFLYLVYTLLSVSTRDRLHQIRDFAGRNANSMGSISFFPKTNKKIDLESKSQRDGRLWESSLPTTTISVSASGEMEKSVLPKEDKKRQSGWKALRKSFLSHKNARLMGIRKPVEAGITSEILVLEECNIHICPSAESLTHHHNRSYPPRLSQEETRVSKLSSATAATTHDDSEHGLPRAL